MDIRENKLEIIYIVPDLVKCFWEFIKTRYGEVYNAGGGKFSNCSILEGLHIIEEKQGLRLKRSSLRIIGRRSYLISIKYGKIQKTLSRMETKLHNKKNNL